MIQIIEQWHDYETRMYYVDPKDFEDLYIDNEIKKALKKNKKHEVHLYIDASDWESNEKRWKGYDEVGGPCGPKEVKIKNGQKVTIDRVVHLQVDFYG